MDALLDGSDLCRDRCVLAGKNIETEARDHGNSTVLIASNHLEQFRRAVASLSRDNAEFSHMSSDRVRQHRPLTTQKLPAAMQHQTRLLLFRFCRHETHRRPVTASQIAAASLASFFCA